MLTSPHLTWLPAPQLTVTLLVQTFRPIVVTITCWLNDIQLIDLQPNDLVPMLSRYQLAQVVLQSSNLDHFNQITQPNIQSDQCRNTISFGQMSFDQTSWLKVKYSPDLAPSPQLPVILLVLVLRPTAVTITCWLNGIRPIDL